MLLLDCGNTAIKCQFENHVSIFYLENDHFNSQFNSYIKIINPNTNVAISSVANAHINQIITNALNTHFLKPAQIAITEDHFANLKIGYNEVKQLGVDRWLSMVATHNINKNHIIIDAGSWIKMDMITTDGQHLGGVIISKSKSDEDEIFNRFKLDNHSCLNKKRLFGTSTHQCLCLSLHQYGLNAVNVLLAQWLTYLKQPCHIIITGGDASKVKQSIQHIDKELQKYILDIQQKENLVLLGLSTKYNK